MASDWYAQEHTYPICDTVLRMGVSDQLALAVIERIMRADGLTREQRRRYWDTRTISARYRRAAGSGASVGGGTG